MGCGRILLALICPPLAVIDCGCIAIVVVLFCTIWGWIPGVIAALVIAYIGNQAARSAT